jgi:two-component system sensor kinase FixL
VDNSADILDQDDWLTYLLDNAHDIVAITHPDGRLVYVNKVWSSTMGYSPEEVKGESIYSFVHPDERAYFKGYRDRALKDAKSAKELELRFISKNGTELRALGRTFVKMQNGQPLYSLGIFRDVTIARKQEQKLAIYDIELDQRQQSLLELLNNAPDAVVLINPESHILFWNKKATAIFGWEADEVIGTFLTNAIIPPEYQKAHLEGMKRFLTTGQAKVLNTTIDITAVNKSRERLYVALTISQTQWEGNMAFIAFVRDISLQKRAQLELEEKKQELEVSNQRLEQYAHVTSHDIKEPIRQMKVFSDLLNIKFGHELPEKARNYLNKIDRFCDRLISTVNGVLTFSSLRANNEPYESIDLNLIIENIERDLDLLIQEKNATIKYRKLPQLQGMSFLIHQLFYNLISNSLKFSREHEVCIITINAASVTEQDLPQDLDVKAGPYFLITVTDNGIGFDQKDAERIFETYTRLNPKDRYEGTGLGLAICKSIVVMHHGLIRAYGEPGKGAKFEIFIPMQKPAVPATELPRP